MSPAWKTVLSVVTDRLRSFLPQLEAANTLLESKTTNIEDVNEDEEYIEMVPPHGHQC